MIDEKRSFYVYVPFEIFKVGPFRTFIREKFQDKTQVIQ